MPRRLDARERERFTHVPRRDVERARLVTVPLLTPGVAGMTLDRWILLRRGHEDDSDLVAHELVHVRQWRELGVVRFLARYLGAYARGRWRRLGHKAAYEAIPFEVEARSITGR
jgi:hypothetical protein